MKRWTTEEITTLASMRAEGKTYGEIAEAIGRPRHSVEQYASSLRKGTAGLRKKEEPQSPTPRMKTLDDFTPRKMIRKLYEMGYRIEGNELVLIEKHVVNIFSILNDEQ